MGHSTKSANACFTALHEKFVHYFVVWLGPTSVFYSNKE
jgi:hypothetical protein